MASELRFGPKKLDPKLSGGLILYYEIDAVILKSSGVEVIKVNEIKPSESKEFPFELIQMLAPSTVSDIVMLYTNLVTVKVNTVISIMYVSKWVDRICRI